MAGAEKATILVVDDSPIDRRVAGGFVEEAGFVALFAADGVEALEVVERELPDMVLTDLRMPNKDGLELVKEMRTLHPSIPVILMTAYGSEQTAMAALRAGAANYLPKPRLGRELGSVLNVVRSAMAATLQEEQVREFLQVQESHYVLGYEPGGARALVNHLQDTLVRMHLCPESDLVRVGTALTEALANAIDHGNLELDSALRERPDGEYWKQGERRSRRSPYRERRVHVQARFTRTKATFVVRDEGPGFDVQQLPDPLDPENITKASGRGVMLIRTFMDEVCFNDAGNEITMVMLPEPVGAE